MTNCITLNTYIIDDITCNVGLLSKKLFAMIVHKVYFSIDRTSIIIGMVYCSLPINTQFLYSRPYIIQES